MVTFLVVLFIFLTWPGFVLRSISVSIVLAGGLLALTALGFVAYYLTTIDPYWYFVAAVMGPLMYLKHRVEKREEQEREEQERQSSEA